VAYMHDKWQVVIRFLVRTTSRELIAVLDDLNGGDHHGLLLRFMRFVNPAPRSKRGNLRQSLRVILCHFATMACVTDSRHFMHSVVVFAYEILPAKASWSLVADRRGVRQISIGLFGNTDSEMHVILNPIGGDGLEICQREGLQATKFLQTNAWGTWAGTPSTSRACL
jgi:hypothetical protein